MSLPSRQLDSDQEPSGKSPLNRSSDWGALARRARLPESLSIVVPCYNEAEVVQALSERLTQVISALGINAEIILVDDRREDQTWQLILELRQHNQLIKAIRLARNSGQQLALTCGLDQANGEVVVIMDADLQDPPELLGAMIERWQAGYDVVYGKRVKREGESLGKRSFAYIFYRLFARLTGFSLPSDTGDFRLMDRKVVFALRNLRERHRFLRGMVSWVGFSQTPLEYSRPQRFAGTSKYPFRKSLRLALDALVSFSVTPLRGFLLLGGLFCLVGAGVLFSAAYLYFIRDTPSTMRLILGCSSLGLGIQCLLFGVLAEYVGRIFELVQARPLYIVDSVVGEPFSEPQR